MNRRPWNYADVWETVAAERGSATALVHGDRRVSWSELDRRADGVAAALIESGAAHQERIACYLYNSPEYLETVFAACKASLVPVNTNYRYGPDELAYLWDNADAVAVVFHGVFAERIAGMRDRARRVRTWLWVDDGSGPCPAWAVPYEHAATQKVGHSVRGARARSGDDLIMIYTGGTTGMPKGVMWRQDDLYRCFDTRNEPESFDPDVVRARVRAEQPDPGVPGAPLMHATGFMFALSLLNQGGTVVTLTSRTFDPEELLTTIERERVIALAVVGDAFARPLVEAAEAALEPHDLSSLALIVSAGVMFSADVKAALARQAPGALIVDVLGSTEAHGLGTAVSSASGGASTAKFRLGAHALVLADDGSAVGPGRRGRLAVRGLTPIGYHKDPEKTAATFPEIDGERYAVPGDWAQVESDGTITLLGRGSLCINTGGEKVFPEEVEEALKTHPVVRDAIVVGVPDDRFGEAIAAGIEAREDGWSAAELASHVRSQLASYKAPRHVVAFTALPRGPNGKADYAATRDGVLAALGMVGARQGGHAD